MQQGIAAAGHRQFPVLCRALKGLSPSHSQQLELEDALASTAYMEGPCGPPDDGLSKQPYLWQCFASCIHYWGAPFCVPAAKDNLLALSPH